MKTALALLALVMLSCSQTGTSTATAPPSSGSSSPSPAGSSPLSTVDFSCRLPVVVGNKAGDGYEYDGGLIKFPAAAYTADPAGVIRRPPGQDVFATSASPTLKGVQQNGPPFYDSAVKRWVPANSAQSSSDGLSYAYTTGVAQRLQIHIVDARTGVEKIYETELETYNFVADYDKGLVYLTGTGLGGPGYGVWAFDPAAGSAHRVSASGGVFAIRGGFAWLGRFDPRDKPPQGYHELAPINTIVRMALATGAETVWYYQPGQYLELSGFDGRGNPVISLPAGQQSYDATELRLVPQPATSGVVVSPGDIYLSPPQGDGDRIWFGGRNGIYLYTQSRGLVKVFNFNGNADLKMFPAGYCV